MSDSPKDEAPAGRVVREAGGLISGFGSMSASDDADAFLAELMRKYTKFQERKPITRKR